MSGQGLLELSSQRIEASVVPIRSVDSEARRFLRQYECNFGGKALPMGRKEVVCYRLHDRRVGKTGRG